MKTVQTTSYSVLINGEPKGFIKPSHRIRQGDPFPPYLSLLCAKGLSTLLKQSTEASKTQRILFCRWGICISHLLFVDDRLFFYEATHTEFQNLLHVLSQYEEALGQAIN